MVEVRTLARSLSVYQGHLTKLPDPPFSWAGIEYVEIVLWGSLEYVEIVLEVTFDM